MTEKQTVRIRVSDAQLKALELQYNKEGQDFSSSSALVSYALEDLSTRMQRDAVQKMDGLEALLSTLIHQEMMYFMDQMDKRFLKPLRNQAIHTGVISKVLEDHFLSHLGTKEKEYLMTEYRKKVLVEIQLKQSHLSFEDIKDS